MNKKWKTLAGMPAFVFCQRVLQNLSRDYASLVAAGLAFYFLMAIFPAMAAAVSICGLFFHPDFLEQQLNLLSRFLPAESLGILSRQVDVLVSSGRGTLGFGLLLSIVLALYSATQGVKALIRGLNIAFNEPEKRNVFVFNATAFALTIVLTIYFIAALGIIAGLPLLIKTAAAPIATLHHLHLLRWPLLVILAFAGLEIVYRFAPSRSGASFRTVSVGAIAATILWMGSSSLFSIFVTNFGRYNQIYGPLSAVVILLLWFWLSGYIILLGAEIDTVLQDMRRKR